MIQPVDDSGPEPGADPAPATRIWNLLPYLAVLLAAAVGRLPALGAWWHGQEWELLGRAAGLGALPQAGGPARLLTEQLWWAATYPLFGLAAEPQAWLRILLHAGNALLVVKLAGRAGLGPLARLLAGLLFAGSPLAFTSLYTALGVQRLLAALLALAAIDRWLAGGRRHLLLAFLLGLLSLLAGELALGLPLFFTALLWLRLGPGIEDQAFAWALTLLLLLAAVTVGTLLLVQLPGGAGGAGDLATLGTNLGEFGWWLMSPGHILARELTWTMVAGGGMLFLLWVAWATMMWRHDSVLPVVTLLGALITLGPALLKTDNAPGDAYLAAAAGALGLASVLPRKWNLDVATLLGLTAVAGAWGFLGMQGRISARGVGGLPADPAVQATALSWQTTRQLRELPLGSEIAGSTLILLQMPESVQDLPRESGLGSAQVRHTPLYRTLAGTAGPRLLLEPGIAVRWTNTLVDCPAEALVLCESPRGFKFWGRTEVAAFYAALTDIARGQFERARLHLLKGGRLHQNTIAFAWDPERMVVPLQQVLARRQEFIDWTVHLLEGGEHSGFEVGAIQDVFFELLSACTGRSVEDLAAGSTLIKRPQSGGPEPPDRED